MAKNANKKTEQKAPTELSTNAYNTPAGIEAARKSVLGDYTALLEVLRTKSNSVKYQIQTIDNFFDKYDRYVGVVQNINELTEKKHVHPFHLFWLTPDGKPARPVSAARLPVLKRLLARGVSPNLLPGSDLIDPLAFAVASNDYTVAKLFLQKGANPNTIHPVGGGMTLLMKALLDLDKKMVKFLLKNDADPNYPGGCGKDYSTDKTYHYSPLCYLHEAVSGTGDPVSLIAPAFKTFRRDIGSLVKLLCAAGAELNEKSGTEQKSLKQLMARAKDDKYHSEWTTLIAGIEKSQSGAKTISASR